MSQQGTAPAPSSAQNIVGQLAKFFPQAMPVRLGVRVTQPNTGWPGETVVVEFATSSEVLFALYQPLEFGDRVHLQNADGSLNTNGRIVAVQYHSGRTAVAARFVEVVPNWIVNP